MNHKFKYNEDKLLGEITSYIDATYNQHYVNPIRNIQSLDSIIASGNGLGFTVGNIQKYSARYRKKGKSPDDHRKDLLKIIHYGILALYCHDIENEESNVKDSLEPGNDSYTAEFLRD